MRVVYTREALRELDGILKMTAAEFPAAYDGFVLRVRSVERRIALWPESALSVAEQPGVRMVPLVRYPFKLFYRVTSDTVEILHIHHAARRVP